MSRAEIEFILVHSGAAALVTSSEFAGVDAQNCVGRSHRLRHVITIDSLPGVADALCWTDVLARAARALRRRHDAMTTDT
jgi:hypothetical protein